MDRGTACRRLCTFTGRIEYIWFVEFDFTTDGNLSHCRIFPSFPAKGQTITKNILCPLYHIDEATTTNLIHLLPLQPTAGFELLVRYVDTLAKIHDLPLAEVELCREDGSVVDISAVQVLAHGQHSVVLIPSASSDFVIKISRSFLIDHERRIHNLVDRDGQSLRALVPGGYGEVKGVGTGLRFIQLRGVGDPLTNSHITDANTLAQFWDQAASGLTALHAMKVLHRDIKPSNMVVIHGQLVLNDFDVSCEMSDVKQCEYLDVGTKDYRSPRLEGHWRERDDWLSLALSFLSLRLPFPFHDKRQVLENALILDWVPRAMKVKIRDAYSNK